jgi:hypothetical protein
VLDTIAFAIHKGNCRRNTIINLITDHFIDVDTDDYPSLSSEVSSSSSLHATGFSSSSSMIWQCRYAMGLIGDYLIRPLVSLPLTLPIDKWADGTPMRLPPPSVHHHPVLKSK